MRSKVDEGKKRRKLHDFSKSRSALQLLIQIIALISKSSTNSQHFFVKFSSHLQIYNIFLLLIKFYNKKMLQICK